MNAPHDPRRPTWRDWVTVDNVCITLGVLFASIGAGLLSAAAGFITGGALLITLTVLKVILEEVVR